MSATENLQVRIQMFFSKHLTAPKPHRFVYQLTSGVIGSRLPGVEPAVLLLTVKGRKSGNSHTTPLVYFDIGGQVVVAGTNNGKDHHPDWCLNLLSSQDAIVQVGQARHKVRGRLARGEERERLWTNMTERHPLFSAYQERTSREIPVIVLETIS